ncbi:hypothetical protein [Polaromonas sp.]|uniref:hypothetical protein n=1 Tax=Polaromonas sp. TaxID=1869339 RepID=UPI003CA40F78
MDKLKDIWASVLAHVSERTTNPLSFSFTVSWAAWNYRFLVVLFSAESPAKTFSQIDAIYASGWARWGSGFLAPLLTALAYVYLYPYLTEKVVQFYRARQIAIANAVKKVEGNRLMTPDEVSQIVRRHEGDLRTAREELAATHTMVAQLRDALAAAEVEAKRGTAQAASEAVSEGSAAEDEESLSEKPSTPPDVGGQEIETVMGPAGPVSLLRRHLTVLTSIAESMARSGDVADDTGIRKYWVEESLKDLVDLAFARQDSMSFYSATDLGRDFLRKSIANGKWDVPA